MTVWRSLAVALMCVVTALWLVPVGCAWWASTGVFSTHRFDPVQWRARVPDALDATCYRGGMARDIQRRVVTVGMKRHEVRAALGSPDSDQPGEFRYVLGMCSGLGMDFDDLHVLFNERGEVAHVAIRQH